MLRTFSLASALMLLAFAASRSNVHADESAELSTLSVKDFGLEVQAPAHWKLVAKAEDSMAFGVTIPNEDRQQVAGVKCEIAAAPESLEEYRTRIDRRAERERVSGVTLKTNEIRDVDGGKLLVTHWTFEPKGQPAVNDLELRVIANDQLYTFTLRAPAPVFDAVRPPFEKMVATAKLTPPETGLELTKEGYCVQKKFRFGLKLPKNWKPSFPLSNESLFWATAKAKGIWNDNLLVIASKTQPLDIEALAEQVPAKLREEDPNCTVKSCGRVPQGKIGDALETVVETKRGPFRITVLERRYTGRRYNYEIKFTVMSEVFESSADELRKSADSFVEFVAPQDPKGGAT